MNGYTIELAGVEIITEGVDDWRTLMGTGLVKDAHQIAYSNSQNDRTDLWVYRVEMLDGSKQVATISKHY